MKAVVTRKQKKPPKAVTTYMAEFDGTEDGVREYILRQIEFFNEIQDKGASTVKRWIGFKMGCSPAAAMTAIRWAETSPSSSTRNSDRAPQTRSSC
jgi:hypothetical protein